MEQITSRNQRRAENWINKTTMKKKPVDMRIEFVRNHMIRYVPEVLVKKLINLIKKAPDDLVQDAIDSKVMNLTIEIPIKFK